jgi:triacylglycerol lipase
MSRKSGETRGTRDLTNIWGPAKSRTTVVFFNNKREMSREIHNLPPGFPHMRLWTELMGRTLLTYLEDHQETTVPIWTEALFPAELLFLHAAPVYYGLGVPRGDGTAVVLIPGFLAPDAYLLPLHWWLGRIGYAALGSGIGFNADCPNVLIEEKLNKTIEEALEVTGRKVHLIGHSLGGIIARAVAAQRPKDVASVITLGAPFRGIVAHRTVLRAAESVRLRVVQERKAGVLADCYTGRCTCDFVKSVRKCMPSKVLETAIYTQDDGVVDWQYCTTTDATQIFRCVEHMWDYPLILPCIRSSLIAWRRRAARLSSLLNSTQNHFVDDAGEAA